ncbi:MAG TPA: protein-disulfide reductase DsbD domain-containing protein [Burkholderiales bacterium]|nr:protein-disulfide reductase DsbD domain-containing protein [Burkholderiales bacterium]
MPTPLRHALLFAAALTLLALGNGRAALSADDLLEPEKAFRVSTRGLDDRTVEVRFEIADGYYMYRDRFKFETAAGKVLADAELPAGVLKKDEFFGETETYRREVLIRVPLTAGDLERGRVKLKVTSQGCSDTGVCYVPLEQVVDVRLPGSPSGSGPAASAQIDAWLAQGWFKALLAAAALAIFALSLRFAPPLKSLRGAARAARWPYPALAFAFAALVATAAAPVLLEQVRDAVWAALLIMAAVWLRVLDPLPEHTRGFVRFGKGLGVMALVGGVVLLAFALGARGLLVAQSMTAVPAGHAAPRFERIADVRELETRVRGAPLPTMLDFYADWCVTCKEMERFTFSDPAVAERMGRMQLLQTDVTRNTSTDKGLLRRFGLFGPPAILFFDQTGNEMRSLRVIGYKSAEEFRTVLDDVLSGAGKAAGDRP